MDQPTDTPRPITRKMERFCQEYLVDMNGSAAARRAGVSDASARTFQYRWLRDARVRARIDELMKEREQLTRVKGFKVLEELATVALSSLDHYLVDDRGNVTVKADAPPGALGAISSVRRTAKKTRKGVEYAVDIKFFDKNPAIANAMKHLGLLKDEVHHRDLTLEDLIREAADNPDAGDPATP